MMCFSFDKITCSFVEDRLKESKEGVSEGSWEVTITIQARAEGCKRGDEKQLQPETTARG